MNIIINTAGRVLYAEPHIRLTEAGAYGRDWHDAGLTTANASWHEVSTLPPCFAVGEWSYAPENGAWSPIDGALDLTVFRKELAGRIDAAVLAIFDKPITLAKVYERREAEARAFKDAGYTGAPGAYLQNFADPAGMSYKDAADLVLAQAAGLRSAQDQLETLRMKKNLVLRASTATDAWQIASDIQAVIHAIASALP